MTKLLDKICKVRDLVTSKDYDKLKFYNVQISNLEEEIHRHIVKKAKDYNYKLDFTSQDLRELAQDIHSLFEKWDTAMCPEKNIKKILKDMKGGQVNLNPFFDATIPVIKARGQSIKELTGLLNMIEYHAVYLYMLEEASNDKFALEYTERF